MKAQLNRAELLAALNAANKVTGDKIYANVRLEVADGATFLIATDLLAGFRWRIDNVEVIQSGVVLLPETKVRLILNESREESVHLDADAYRVVVTVGLSQFEFAVDTPDLFAVPSFDVDGASTQVAGGEFVRMANQLSSMTCGSIVHEKYSMEGVLVDVAGTTMTLVRTDAKRLAIASGDCTKSQFTGQIHEAAIEVAKAAIADPDQLIEVSMSLSVSMIDCGKVMAFSRLIERAFPPFRSVIPKKFETSIVLDSAALLATVKRVAMMTDRESTRVDLEMENGRLTASAKSQHGTARATMAIDYQGKPMSIAFTPKYVVDCMRTHSGTIEMKLVDSRTIAMFAADRYQHLIVPLVETTK
jgi:DNA polymerase III subunit beta